MRIAQDDGMRRAIGEADVILATSMLNLPAARGMYPALIKPTVVYFHENQFAYPIGSSGRHGDKRSDSSSIAATVDLHFAYSQFQTATIADAVVFNSQHNRQTFLSGCETFLRRMPDTRYPSTVSMIAAKSHIVPPGFEPCFTSPATAIVDRDRDTIAIGWVGRLESDRRFDRLIAVVDRLATHSTKFELILLGPRPNRMPQTWSAMLDRHADRVRIDGFVKSEPVYRNYLASMDIVISTTDHEFFGIAMCEAIHAGAIPVVPDGLAYDDYVPDRLRIRRDDDFVRNMCDRILELRDSHRRTQLRSRCQASISTLTRRSMVDRLDALLESVV